ncbi:hypothetical protein [Sphingomonas sp.]|uniref:hypothetical protein n=1 Tax=Sphingomonas sp. TaxID=28214 RepID=UPI003B005813
MGIARSVNGLHWHQAPTLERAPLHDGYAYPAVIQRRDGLVHVTYWDRRRIRHIVLDPARLT